MEQGVVGIVMTEDCHEAFIEAVDQCIANALGELGFTSKWAHCVHHTLVVCKNRGANNVVITIDIQLLGMLD